MKVGRRALAIPGARDIRAILAQNRQASNLKAPVEKRGLFLLLVIPIVREPFTKISCSRTRIKLYFFICFKIIILWINQFC